MSAEYDVVPKSGKLKLKGTQQQQHQHLKVEKKKKKRRMEKKSDEGERQKLDADQQHEHAATTTTSIDTVVESKIRENQALALKHKTKAQLRHASMRQKQLEKFAKKKATKTYKTRMEEYNIYLLNMTDHNCLAKVSWVK